MPKLGYSLNWAVYVFEVLAKFFITHFLFFAQQLIIFFIIFIFLILDEFNNIYFIILFSLVAYFNYYIPPTAKGYIFGHNINFRWI